MESNKKLEYTKPNLELHEGFEEDVLLSGCTPVLQDDPEACTGYENQ